MERRGNLRASNQSLYSSVAERQSCKLKVLGSIPSGGLLRLCLSRLESKDEGREIRTPNLLIWSQTRCRCAIPPMAETSVNPLGRRPGTSGPERLLPFLAARRSGSPQIDGPGELPPLEARWPGQGKLPGSCNPWAAEAFLQPGSRSLPAALLEAFPALRGCLCPIRKPQPFWEPSGQGFGLSHLRACHSRARVWGQGKPFSGQGFRSSHLRAKGSGQAQTCPPCRNTALHHAMRANKFTKNAAKNRRGLRPRTPADLNNVNLF
jgi:hypothetical protein